jgi:hypothetical protein
MNCRESRPLLPLFLDGELEARQMRDVALHSTRCTNCEGELRRMERLQELVVASVAAEIDEIDLSQVWEGVSSRIAPVSRSWRERTAQRFAEWRDGFPPMGRVLMPLSAAAAVAVLAALLWTPRAKAPDQVAATDATDNSAVVDSVQSNGVNSVAFLREPETNTMVLWITDNGPAPFEDSGDVP